VLLVSLILGCFASIYSQDIVRKQLDVPKVDPSFITLDGQMDETEWQSAGEVNLITSTGYEIFANKYYREDLVEPEYDALYARLLWSQDTLYAFIHIDEFVNDSTNLFWDGKWTGDQLFLSLSNRLGKDMMGWYDGNIYAAPDGPYHYLILGDQVTLNNGDTSYVPEEYRKCFDQSDSLLVPDASKYVRWATFIDTLTGEWNIEMAIYQPNVNAGGKIGFNIGGSTGSSQSQAVYGDAYGYYTWQPNVPNDPFGDPFGNGDPGFYNLANDDYWAVLHFTPDVSDIVRKTVSVPKVDPTFITLDGQMNEPEWQNAAKVNLITSTGYEIFANKYYREDLVEPEYDELYARLLWAQDTLYAFINIDEFVNDSTNLFWDGKWTGDQLFLSISNRLGRNMMGWYDGNIYAAPDGPYHYLILGDQVTLNNGETSYIPEEYRGCFDDTVKIFNASDYVRWVTFIDTLTGIWKIEMAIYQPHVNDQSAIAFNLGGSTGSSQSQAVYGDAYGYYTWQPNVLNDPFGDPFGNGDPGFYNLANNEYWALLYFYSTLTGVEPEEYNGKIPQEFYLRQNFPNPFNPITNIRFEVPNSTPVTINIYNAVGQLVTTLINGQAFAPGTYSVTWDASNVSSGVYFYQLKTDSFQQTMKMILIK
jgi:hypothetical protein